MSFVTHDAVRFTVNSNTYLFAASQLVPFGYSPRTANQVTQEMEGGQVKIITLDSNVRETFDFRINMMPADDFTVPGSTTYNGADALITMIRTDAEYRANVIEFWDRGSSKISTKTCDVRFWGSSFGLELAQIGGGYENGQLYYGTGRETISFRREIT